MDTLALRAPDAGTEHPGGPAPEATTTDHRWHDHTNCDHDGEVRECPIRELWSLPDVAARGATTDADDTLRGLSRAERRGVPEPAVIG